MARQLEITRSTGTCDAHGPSLIFFPIMEPPVARLTTPDDTWRTVYMTPCGETYCILLQQHCSGFHQVREQLQCRRQQNEPAYLGYLRN